MNKTLDNVNVADVKEKVSDVKVVGNGDMFQLMCKASSEKEGWRKEIKMKTLISSFLVSLFLVTGVQADTDYYLDRVIYQACIEDRCGLIDTQNVDGYAEVRDTGPYTAMTGIEAEALACPKDCSLDGEPALQASPQPICDCFDVSASSDSVSYARRGQLYFLGAETLHVIRRGSVAAGASDPAMILMLETGELLLYREIVE